MTKTEKYLYILANGGDAPDDCCMTVMQSLIADTIIRVNNLQAEIEAFVPITNNEIDAVLAQE